ncbi:hypothetical protein RvY_04202-2 [Ramazzottius varieornatus]|nr:hypothetical protein RvY_04202-2 [Ramazzottius varieornatus]
MLLMLRHLITLKLCHGSIGDRYEMTFSVKLIVLLALTVGFAGIAVSINAHNQSLVTTSNYQWDYLVLSIRWSQAGCGFYFSETEGTANQILCVDTNSSCPDGRWVIHGLWPTKNGTDGPNYCLNNQTEASIIWNNSFVTGNSALYPRLLFHWPDMLVSNGSSPEGFWRYEWMKHGTCALSFAPLDTVGEYLSTALQLKDRFDISGMLNAAEVIPGCARKDVGTSTLEVFDRLSEGKLRIRFKLAKRLTSKKYLEEVGVCFDLGFDMVDCPA